MKATGDSGALEKALRDVADEQRLAYNWSRIEERRRRRHALPGRLVFPAAALVAVGVIAGMVVFSASDAREGPKPLLLELSEWTPLMEVPSGATQNKRVTLLDGSCLILAPGTSLKVRESSAQRFELELIGGWARFNVVPGQGRTWVVDAGLGRVVVLGTQFTVSRTPRAVKVSVHRGTVALQRSPEGGEIAKLSAGESRELLPPNLASTVASASPVSEVISAPAAIDDADVSPKTAKIKAQTAVRTGSMPEAPMTDLAGLGSSEQLNALLKKVDELRKDKRPKEAALLLDRILREYPGDPAVGLVALTLGRIRLDTLNQPRPAAAALRRAAAFKGLPAPLKEQAHARCVEAFHRAGDDASARSMRDRFKSHFPNGVWLPWVERWAGEE